MELIEYFRVRAERRRETPSVERPDDLVTMLNRRRARRRRPRGRHVIGSCFLLLLAGIDTTWSAIGSSLWHLATHPDDQACLRREPELMNTAVEALLRFYSPVTMARYVIEDVKVGGVPHEVGRPGADDVPAGNRDPEMFDDADTFIIDRVRNSHFAFGSGIHRCLGSNLARMELRVAIEESLRQIPPPWRRTGGQLRRPRNVPVRW